MASALGGMLPYVIGLLIAPLPIAVVAVLIGGREGTRKGVVFGVTWWLVSFVVVLVLSLVFAAPDRVPGVAPGWDSGIRIILGVALLLWAARNFVEMRRGSTGTPESLKGIGEPAPDRLAALAARLLLDDPLRPAMLIAAALELGSRRLSAIEDLLPAAVFALVGTITVVLPMLIRISTRWLLRHNDLLVFVTSLCFGVALLLTGLRQLQ